MTRHATVSQQEWIKARKELLRKEKELTQLRDELAQQRRNLPWTRIDKTYVFDDGQGKRSLAELFGPHSQLIVYHFMFDPAWSEGCKSCSLVADHYDPLIVHLAHRDVSMVTVSLAPIEKLLSFKHRMGWNFEWVSSLGSEFNRDFYVTFTPEELAQKTANYNYDYKPFPVTEAPGVSVFVKDDNSQVFHTYSSYARGLESILGIYSLLDFVPKGRGEDDLTYPMEWIRHRDRYDDAAFVDPYVEFFANGVPEAQAVGAKGRS
jgi:predicted dithiol-disulfide oxidoreductase (DUF899 family)